jgi:hypothetical protein
MKQNRKGWATCQPRLGTSGYNHFMSDLLYLSASTDAVDAALVTIERAVTTFAKANKTPMSKIAGIGDSANDLPFLRVPGLGMRGCPANSQPVVRAEIAKLDSGILLSSSFADGFLEFYELAEKRGISYVFADKDGVLVWKDNDALTHKNALSAVFRGMGLESRPFVFILTGSSREQNVAFIESYNSDGAFASNQKIRELPFIVLAENGALQINVLTRETREDLSMIDAKFLKLLKSSFEKRVLTRLEKEVLPRFGLEWGQDASDQADRIWIPPKRTMFTVNLPRTFRGERDYRASRGGEELRRTILNCMIEEADTIGMRYCLL